MEDDFGGYHCAICRDDAYKERTRLTAERNRRTAERNREKALDSERVQRRYDEMQVRQRAQEEQYNDAWEARQAREEAARVKITLRIGVFFDGTGNNPFNVEMGRKCGAHHPVSAQDMDGNCKPYMQDPDSSYGGEVTNVKRLYDLYSKSTDSGKVIQQKLAFDKVYIEGIGTMAGEQDRVLLGMALGRG
ncbi:hypothetical protein [Pseudomonas sp. 6D_7.1_Bac1]|uniref:hypothetical protein n=1 Tax=Pseudomonas sp. 6D_7.1_Bac1 TaxID=2971615 RepID=UPI0021C930E2|nr:hypothetical protein [Pseudomonas sp. 6D_7.1_Bac1]MCU1752760.1 hypothetical protein [Pseudomonas sp. 6D_7.1_Bac1]